MVSVTLVGCTLCTVIPAGTRTETSAVETLPVGAGVGRSCVIWVGSLDKSDRPSTESERKTFPEAEVACDGDGLSQRAEWAAAAQSYMTYALHKLAICLHRAG